MPDAHARQPANAGYGRAPGRHLGFTNVTLGGPFATPRARLTVSCFWTSFAHSSRSGWRMILSAVSGIKMVKRMSATLDETRKLAPAAAGRWFCKISSFSIFPLASPSRHLRCQVSARFRPRTMTDSPALHSLHSAAAIRRRQVRLAPAERSRFVPTAANCRDSQETNRARPKKQNGRETSSGQDRQ